MIYTLKDFSREIVGTVSYNFEKMLLKNSNLENKNNVNNCVFFSSDGVRKYMYNCFSGKNLRNLIISYVLELCFT